MLTSTPRIRIAGITVAVLAFAAPVAAQNVSRTPDQVLASESYVRPPAEIERLVLAPRYLNVSLTNQSPTRHHFLKLQGDGIPTVQSFGKPWYNLAGFQVDPRANRSRTLTTRGGKSIDVIDATTGKSVSIEAPTGATISAPRWSPDGKEIA